MPEQEGIPRRKFLQSAAGGAGALAAGPVLERIESGPAQEGPPNFVFIFTDDQRADALGCAGNPIVQTPVMDALARNGVRFEQAFVTTPICAASRASVVSGTYERTHQFTFGTPPLSRSYTDISYPVRLRDAGYRTGYFGKFGMQVEEGVRDEMFDVFEEITRTPYFKEVDGERIHTTDLITDRGIDFIRQAGGGQPFCLSLGYNVPHAEDGDPAQHFWPEEVDDLYRDVVIPPPEPSGRKFYESQPLFLQHSLNRQRWYWKFDTPEKYQHMVRGYYRMITGVDRAIGRLRKALEEQGVADNTVIILMGDNGYFLGERGFAGKWYMYDRSIAVPLIVYDPRLPASQRGRVLSEFALNVDLAPTMLEMAGLSIPDAMQGRSLVPLLEDQSVDWRTEVFCEHLFDHDDIPKSEGVRTDRWKYLRYPEHTNSEELYDLEHDPHETTDLAWRSEYRDTLLKLRERCDRMIQQLKADRL